MASCAVTEDVGRCHQPSPRSSGNGAQPCSAAPWLFLPRLPHSSGSCWVFRFFPTVPGYPTPSVALPPSTSIQWPRGLIPSLLKTHWRQNRKVGKMFHKSPLVTLAALLLLAPGLSQAEAQPKDVCCCDMDRNPRGSRRNPRSLLTSLSCFDLLSDLDLNWVLIKVKNNSTWENLVV